MTKTYRIGMRVVGARWVKKPATYNCFPGILVKIGDTYTVKCRDGKLRKFKLIYPLK